MTENRPHPQDATEQAGQTAERISRLRDLGLKVHAEGALRPSTAPVPGNAQTRDLCPRRGASRQARG